MGIGPDAGKVSDADLRLILQAPPEVTGRDLAEILGLSLAVTNKMRRRESKRAITMSRQLGLIPSVLAPEVHRELRATGRLPGPPPRT